MNILITGAAQGIGAAIARKLSNKENILTLVDLQADKLNAIAEELRNSNKEVFEFTGNLADESFILSLKKHIQEANINVLINNAAVAPKLKSFEYSSLEDLDLAYKVNIRAPFELIQAAIPVMKQNGSGHILNLASRASIYGYENMAIYSATKAAISTFSGTIALENPEIKAITIIPGRTNTQMQATLRGEHEASNSQSPEYVGEVIANLLIGEILVKNGEFVIIDFGKYKVVSELDKIDLHTNMH